MSETLLFLDSKNGIGESSDFTVYFNPPILLDHSKDYKIALVGTDIWYSWYNITEKNNKFKYHNGTDWITIKIPGGAYNISDLNREIKRLVEAGGDEDDPIVIRANFNTLKSRIIIADDYQVDFDIDNSLRDLLGFEGKTLSAGLHEGKNQVDITNIHSILIKCSLVSSSYLNGKTSDIIYTFSPNKPPGSLLSIQPNQLIYARISRTSEISAITMKVTNQDNELIDFNGERTTFFIQLKTV